MSDEQQSQAQGTSAAGNPPIPVQPAAPVAVPPVQPAAVPVQPLAPTPTPAPVQPAAPVAVPPAQPASIPVAPIAVQPTAPAASSAPVTVPVQPVPAAAPAAQPAVAAPVSDGRKKVLIVEDERPLAHALELKLGHEGYNTQTASTGTEGLAKAIDGGFDLMLLDLILPELDGFELLKQLREKNKDLKVVILSNLGQEEDKKRVEALNVAKYCVKSNMPLAAVVNTVKVLTS